MKRVCLAMLVVCMLVLASAPVVYGANEVAVYLTGESRSLTVDFGNPEGFMFHAAATEYAGNIALRLRLAHLLGKTGVGSYYVHAGATGDLSDLGGVVPEVGLMGVNRMEATVLTAEVSAAYLAPEVVFVWQAGFGIRLRDRLYLRGFVQGHAADPTVVTGVGLSYQF